MLKKITQNSPKYLYICLLYQYDNAFIPHSLLIIFMTIFRFAVSPFVIIWWASDILMTVEYIHLVIIFGRINEIPI